MLEKICGIICVLLALTVIACAEILVFREGIKEGERSAMARMCIPSVQHKEAEDFVTVMLDDQVFYHTVRPH